MDLGSTTRKLSEIKNILPCLVAYRDNIEHDEHEKELFNIYIEEANYILRNYPSIEEEPTWSLIDILKRLANIVGKKKEKVA